MALIKCTECGKEISDSAVSCPHCGYKTSRGQTVTQAKGFMSQYVVAVVFLLLGVVLLWSGSSFINDYTSSYWGEYLWESGDWIEDSDAVMAVIKIVIGAALVVGFAVDMIVLYYKAKALQSVPIETIVPISSTDNPSMIEITEEKRRYGVCEKCRLTGTVAVSIIPDADHEQKLCSNCIRKYNAKIK